MRPMGEPSTAQKIGASQYAIRQLQRRPAPDPIEFPESLLPFALFEIPTFDFTSGDGYALGILDGFFYGSIAGVASKLLIGNPPSDENDLGFFYSDTFERGVMLDAGVGAAELGCMVAFDAGLYFASGFTGTAYIWLKTTGWGAPGGDLPQYDSPATNAYAAQITDPPAGTCLRLAGTAVWSGSATTPGTQSVNDLLTVMVDQDSGGTVHPSQGWFTLTRLSPLVQSQVVIPE